ncbi:capsular polysaccharide biosynthesis protein CapF [Bacillus cereus]|uniref:capsular polysaccharide biosynthesis protein CapF n=1 Tax=Bacillus cereus TaxID=1396 RepID=UPI000BFB8D02|nr:capsular polysaccharide biosynthesis protein CapF [Bacillus cereus]PGY13300.1 capsular biosynthesis protein [Bacillus cereus]WJE28003.1 capsular polysaccharide biosynthesis protein CapF [Bacillus cereus]
MKILVTGSNGFVGKNLVAELRNRGYDNILEFNRESEKSLLDQYAKECNFVFHLAGVNRPQDESEFMDGNFGFTSELLDLLKKHNNTAPIVITSSIQANMDNPYGISKKAVEDLLFAYREKMKKQVYIYRLPNLFGKWCRPNYNSVVATFCHNIARGIEIQINNPQTELTLCYIDDVLAELLRALEGNPTQNGDFCYVPKDHIIKLGDLADKLYAFSKNRETLVMPSLKNELDKVLYGTFLSYLEEDEFSYKLKKNVDNRGWLAEFIKSDSMGQIFISKTKPGITRGNHWHHTKVEKFLVIQGEASIKFRKIGTAEILEYKVNGEIPEVVDIPVGYTHSIVNNGKEDVITLFWASEIFDQSKPDTYYLEV